FDAFCARCHDEAGRGDGLQAGWFGKGPGTVARLAAILSLLAASERREPGCLAIDAAAVTNAAALWSDYFRPHALAALGEVTEVAMGRPDTQVARVMRWLRETGATRVSRDEIRSQALARTVDAAGADRVIGELEKFGVLSARAPTLNVGAGRPARRWD